ncbi:helical backbone metal receptor [Pseudothermotoga sp. U03pept]|uniref:helical backbone metal receptor n=1 Tax=Pseudothermotoga sp. U03pept TaxID=3447012 RepID=UPI003F0BE5F4
MRIVSLVSGFTETLFEIDAKDQVVGVSTYCSRYVKDLQAVVVGDYLSVDKQQLRTLKPDLVLLTTGVQEKLAAQLKREGFTIFVLPLAKSISGIWENIITLGGLTGKLKEAKELVHKQQMKLCNLQEQNDFNHEPIYVELWLGRYLRTIGGLSFIDDLVYFAGGKNIFSDLCESYITPDLKAVEMLKPKTAIFFQEPDFPIDPSEILRSRKWNWFQKIIHSGITKGRNIIHDGPSILDTIFWLSEQLHETQTQRLC